MVSRPWYKDREMFIPHDLTVHAQTTIKGIEIHCLSSYQNDQFPPLQS